jgi:hypothetical protein
LITSTAERFWPVMITSVIPSSCCCRRARADRTAHFGHDEIRERSPARRRDLLQRIFAVAGASTLKPHYSTLLQPEPLRRVVLDDQNVVVRICARHPVHHPESSTRIVTEIRCQE